MILESKTIKFDYPEKKLPDKDAELHIVLASTNGVKKGELHLGSLMCQVANYSVKGKYFYSFDKDYNVVKHDISDVICWFYTIDESDIGGRKND